jgi:tetratricopeptide (TPR) repeat protein
MRLRDFLLFIFILCLFAIIIGALAGFDPKESAAATQTASADAVGSTTQDATGTPVLAAAQEAEGAQTPQPTEVTAPTPVPATPAVNGEPTAQGSSAKIRNRFGKTFGFLHRVDNMVQELWPLLAGLGLILLAGALTLRAAEETWGQRIEFDALQNGTGDPAFNDSLAGMNAYLRGTLISNIKYLHTIINDYSHRTSAGAEFPMQIALPQDVQTLYTLQKVVDALGEEAPKYVKPLLSLWRYLFPGRGLRIRTTLQSNGDPTRPLAITFEFLDLGTQKNSKVYTVKEGKNLEPSMPPGILCPPEEPVGKQEPSKETLPSPGTAPGNGSVWSLLVATALQKAHLYADAITYYEMTLAENKDNQQAFDGLLSCQKSLAQQAGPAAGFTAAQGLEQGGLLGPAIEGYIALFKDEIPEVRRMWEVALGVTPGLKGEALDKLAWEYRTKLDLHEQAVGLYKRAVLEGHPPSASKLQDIQKEQADYLAEAGGLLLDNAQWVAAETYLTKASACVPDHELTIRHQARLKASRPAQGNKEALADFELGKVYQVQGRQTSATEYYIKAIEKQPDYAEAKEALSKILKETKSLRYRFELLADSALEWLAVELFRQETDRLAGEDDSKKARYHNFYGAYYISLFWHSPFFADLAEQELLQAKRICPDWYMPYKQLGDLYLLKRRIEKYGQQDRILAKEAAAWYEIAVDKCLMKADGTLIWIGSPLKLRLQLAWAVAKLMACSKDFDSLWKHVDDAEALIRKPEQEFEKIKVDGEHQDLYRDLSIWYALVDYRYRKTRDTSGRAQTDLAKFWAWFYLICAVLLDPNRLRQADMNPIQKELYTEDQYRELASEIEIRRQKQMAKTPEEPFTWAEVRDVLKGVNPELVKTFKES